MDLSLLDNVVRYTQGLLGTHPVLLFCSIAILPGVGVPASPLLLLAGVALAKRLSLLDVFVFCLSALFVNMTWTFWLARTQGRTVFRKFMGRYASLLDRVDGPATLVDFAIITRLTPIIPFAVQN